MPSSAETAVRGPLRPIELATAAVLGGITVVLAVVGWILPHASAVQALGAVPMGVLAHRHRPRAVLAATVAGSVVSFLVAGTGPIYSVVTCAVVGGAIGDIKRCGRGPWTAVAVGAVLAPAMGALADATLAVFAATRVLALDQIRNVVHGLANTVAGFPRLAGVAHAVDRFTASALRDWWLSIAAIVALAVACAMAAAWVVLGPVLERLAWMAPEDRLETLEDPRPVGPVPVVLDGVSYRYEGADGDALRGVSLDVDAPGMVAVVGANGSGKSTLARLLAGGRPTAGTVTRPGSAGLGLPGGTALVAQRPESQILGVRVADDVVWGLAPGADVDVAALLDAVGLAGMGDRETSTLSGGELQRLAIAAALARRPRLLLSDESTAMIDQAGRRDMVALLSGLPRRQPMAVVHVTHRVEEAAAADRVIHLAGGRVVHGAGDYLTADEPQAPPPRPAPGAPVLTAARAGHTYAEGTPWAQDALRGIDLTVREGEGLLVVGGNGSGKSTLAWVLAGLLRPTRGECLLDGRPVADQVGAVGLAFQHARLQLQRPTVGADIRAASGVGADAVPGALRVVGLDADLAGRPVDQLSGGQMRRVALAGLLARAPRVLILDEPLAGLDPESRRSVLDVLAGLRNRGLTLVVISHDFEGMRAVCDRTVHIAGGLLVDDAPGAVVATVQP